MTSDERMFWLGVAYGLSQGGWCNDAEEVLSKHLPELHTKIGQKISRGDVKTGGAYWLSNPLETYIKSCGIELPE